MSFFKYYKESADQDGEKLWWPGGPEGFPFRGRTPPTITQNEYDNLKLAGKFRCAMFYLDKEEDTKAYTKIRDKCANGLWALLDKDRTWDAETKSYRIYIEWLELGYDMPEPMSITRSDSNPSGVANDAVAKLIEDNQASYVVPYWKLAGLNSAENGW